MADHLTDAYCSAVRDFTTMVEQVQLKLFGDDDGIFRQVAAITQDILGLRKAITAARELFHKLGTALAVCQRHHPTFSEKHGQRHGAPER